jgi:hypothetical protein
MQQIEDLGTNLHKQLKEKAVISLLFISFG